MSISGDFTSFLKGQYNILPGETMSQCGNITCPRCHLLDPACALVLAVTPAPGMEDTARLNPT